jgi:acid stress-induced BolA-like protein IbaG/YrbA
MTREEVLKLIEAGLPGAEVKVASEDNVHFEAVIIAAAFEGKRAVQRHQLVYATLGPRMGNEIHALALKVFTPQEWREQLR